MTKRTASCTGRLLALDVGDVRCGLAISDPACRVATPLEVQATAELLRDGLRLRQLQEDFEFTGLVVGLPLTLAGEEGPQARHVRSLTDKLLAVAGTDLAALPLTFVDERYSSVQAAATLSEAGLNSRQQRGRRDALAATLLLQGFLDARN
jgi:putative Holliday junction resolvase